MFKYKGYIGKVDFDADDDLFHGEVINTRDVITFQGKSVRELKKSLKDSVEDYLEFCKERGEEPDKPFSGQFIVRVPPEMSGKSLNAWVREAILKTVTSNK
ncbi:MAG: type II toxin-antitoxin system HicB family antitoxin [Planctomycetota bacterium]|jgi:predicted HicB family RNase H-like nuclease